MKYCTCLDKRIKEFRKYECSYKNPTEDECYKCLTWLSSRMKLMLKEITYEKWLIRKTRKKVREKGKKIKDV